MPRPPKFTRGQRVWLAFLAVVLITNVAAFLGRQELSDMAFAAMSVAAIHAIFMDALRRYADAFKSDMLATALAVVGFALWAVGA